MKRRYLPLFAALLLAALLLTGCGAVTTPASGTDIAVATPPASDTNLVVTTPPASDTDLTAPIYITEQDALAAALGHAGYKETEVTGLRVYLDTQDPIAEYEVEFFVGTMEYDYEIDAVSGEILSFEKEARS